MSIEVLENTNPRALRNTLFSYPQFGLLPFKPSDLSEDEKEFVIYRLEDESKELTKIFKRIFKVT